MGRAGGVSVEKGKGEGASLGDVLSRQRGQADDECPGEALRRSSSLQAGSRRAGGGTSGNTVGSDVHYPFCLRV